MSSPFLNLVCLGIPYKLPYQYIDNPQALDYVFCMTNETHFEWDEAKNKANIKKHGIDFKDTVEIFNNPMIIEPDDRADYCEDRYIGMGFLRNLIAVVIFVEKIDKNTIRIISVRKATKHENKFFKKAIKDRLE